MTGGHARTIAWSLTAGIVALGGALVVHLRREGPHEVTGIAPPQVDLSGAQAAVATAIQQARDAVTRAPESAAAWGRLGMLLHIHGYEAEALVCYQHADDLNPAEFRWRYLSGIALRKSNLPRAVDHFQAALRRAPAEVPIHVRLGEALLLLERHDEARHCFAAAARLDPGCAHALFGLARAALRDGRPADAIQLLERAAVLDGDHGAVFAALAQARHRVGDHAGAAEAATAARRMTPEGHLRDATYAALIACGLTAQWCNHRGNRHLTAGRFVEAVDEYRRAVAAEPDEPAFRMNLARALGMAQRHADAAEAYEAAFRIRAPDAFHRMHYGMIVAELGRLNDALRAFQEAARTDPAFAETYHQWASVLFAAGRNEEAVAVLRKAVRQLPDDFDLCVSLAWVLATGEDAGHRNGSEALEHALRACRLCERGEARALAAQAAALAELGRFDEASPVAAEAHATAARAKAPPDVMTQLDKLASAIRERRAYRSNR